MADLQHKDLPESQLHEPKGVSTATSGQIYIANGSGSGAWTNQPIPPGVVSQGVYDYNDLTTASTPIPLSVANTQYEMTNDGAGAFTNLTYALPGLANIWDVATDRFDFNSGSVLRLGDTVDIRFDFEVVTSTANTAVEFDLELGIGGSAYQLVINPLTNFKTAGTYKIIRWIGIYMGDNNTLLNPARVLAKADSTGATVKVNGWYVRALTTSV